MAEQTSHMKKLADAGIKVYKVHGWLRHMYRGTLKYEDRIVEVFIGNEALARQEFKQWAMRLKSHGNLHGYSGRVELLEPHIFESGKIAYEGILLEEYEIKPY